MGAFKLERNSYHGEGQRSCVLPGWNHSERAVAFSVFVLFETLVLLPVVVYYMYELWSLKMHPAIEKRRPEFLLVYHCLLAAFSVERFLRCGLVTGVFAGQKLIDTVDVLYAFIGNALCYCLVFRAYLLMFDLRYQKGKLNGKWKTIINAKSQSKDWFLNHQSTFGNQTWVGWRLFAPVYALSVACLILGHSNWTPFGRTLASTCPLIIDFILLCFLVAVYSLCPRINDVFRIRDEFTGIFTLAICATLLHMTSLLFFDRLAHCIVGTLVMGLAFYGVGLVSTYWVLEHSGTVGHIWMGRVLRLFSKSTTERLKQKALRRRTGTGENSLVESTIAECGMSTRLRDFINDKNGFQKFMAHSIRELSEENLLFTVEVTQFFYLTRALGVVMREATMAPIQIDADAQGLVKGGLISAAQCQLELDHERAAVRTTLTTDTTMTTSSTYLTTIGGSTNSTNVTGMSESGSDLGEVQWLGGLRLPVDLPQSSIVFGENNSIVEGGVQGTFLRMFTGNRGIGTTMSTDMPQTHAALRLYCSHSLDSGGGLHSLDYAASDICPSPRQPLDSDLKAETEIKTKALAIGSDTAVASASGNGKIVKSKSPRSMPQPTMFRKPKASDTLPDEVEMGPVTARRVRSDGDLDADVATVVSAAVGVDKEDAEDMSVSDPLQTREAHTTAYVLEDVRRKAILLCEKYIISGAPYMVNLPFRARRDLRAQYNAGFAELTMSDMQTVFEESAREIYRLMRNTFFRFMSSTE